MRVTTTGPPVLSEPLRTASGREVHDGDTVTPADPIVLPAVNGTSGTLTIGVAPAIPSADLSPNPRAMWWNNIRRAWFTGPADAPVMVDPQPPAPQVHEWHSATIGGRAIPPAVKVSA